MIELPGTVLIIAADSLHPNWRIQFQRMHLTAIVDEAEAAVAVGFPVKVRVVPGVHSVQFAEGLFRSNRVTVAVREGETRVITIKRAKLHSFTRMVPLNLLGSYWPGMRWHADAAEAAALGATSATESQRT
jgi:hypothetical protein